MGSTPPRTPLVPALEERFEVLSELGRGGMGVVLRARDRELGREVAIKLPLLGADPEFEHRFRLEARTMARIRHPHVVQVFDFGVVDGQAFLVMELLEGTSLERANHLSPESLRLVLHQTAKALDEVHRQGLTHRDVKPANLFRTREGRHVLMDFGVVRDTGGSLHTQAGLILGTPDFLAPEVLAGEEPAPPSDWWALGSTIVLLAHGRLPYDFEQVRGAAAGRPLPSPFSPGSLGDPGLESVLRSCLQVDPGLRPRTPGEVDRLLAPAEATLSDELSAPGSGAITQQIQREQPLPGVETHRPGRIWGWKVLLGLTLLVGGFLYPTQPEPSPSHAPGGENPASLRTPPLGPRSRPPPPFLRGTREERTRERDELSLTYVRGDGSLVVLQEGAPEADWKALLQPSSDHWRLLRSQVRLVSDFDAWVRGGGQPELLSQEVQEELAAYDEYLLGEDFPPAFSPWIDTHPISPRPLPSRVQGCDFLGPDLELPEEVGGWFGAALESYRVLLARIEEAEQELEAIEFTSPPPSFHPVTLYGVQQDNLGRFLKQIRTQNDTPRLRFLMRYRAIFLEGGRFLRAGFRALREETSPQWKVTSFLLHCLGQVENVLLAFHLSEFPPELLAGFAAETLWERQMFLDYRRRANSDAGYSTHRGREVFLHRQRLVWECAEENILRAAEEEPRESRGLPLVLHQNLNLLTREAASRDRSKPYLSRSLGPAMRWIQSHPSLERAHFDPALSPIVDFTLLGLSLVGRNEFLPDEQVLSFLSWLQKQEKAIPEELRPSFSESTGSLEATWRARGR